MKTIAMTINGAVREVAVEPGEMLAAALRRIGYKGVKVGCDEGVCGACTVLVDGRALNACHTFAFQADGRTVETIEALGTFEKPHPIQQALADEGAVQCGFCIPGVVLSAKALLDREPHPDEALLKEHLDGHLCRCTGYEKMESAFRSIIGAGEEQKETK